MHHKEKMLISWRGTDMLMCYWALAVLMMGKLRAAINALLPPFEVPMRAEVMGIHTKLQLLLCLQAAEQNVTIIERSSA